MLTLVGNEMDSINEIKDVVECGFCAPYSAADELIVFGQAS